MKKVMKWVGILLLVPILLFLLLTILLYTPPVQNWAVKKAAAIASEKMGMDITVGHVSLRFPLDLTLEDLKAIKDNDSIQGLRDTIADVEKLYVDLQFKPLLQKKVEVDGLGFRNLKINTDGLVDDIRVKGNVNYLDLECHNVDLNTSIACINSAKLDSACLEICMADTVPPDTTETPLDWKIKVEQLQLSRARVDLKLPGDTMRVKAYVGDSKANNAFINLNDNTYKLDDLSLAKTDVDVEMQDKAVVSLNTDKLTASHANISLDDNSYRLSKFEWDGGKASYDVDGAPPAGGFDANHVALSDIHIEAEDFGYEKDRLNLDLKSCSLKEKSGLNVESFKTKLALDQKSVQLDNLYLQTPDSRLKAKVDMDLDAFDDRNPGQLRADVDGSFGKQDIMRFMGKMPDEFMKKWPNQPLSIKGKAEGNMKKLNLKGLNLMLPTSVQMHADGYLANLDNPDKLKADVQLKGMANNIDFVTAMIPSSVSEQVVIPHDIALEGNFKANGNLYGADFTAKEGGGSVKANVSFDSNVMKYSATVDADNFPLQHFLPKMGLSPLTAHIEADGQGTDFMSPATSMRAKAQIKKFKYDQYNLDGMSADAVLSHGRLAADIDSNNPLLDGNISFDALMDKKKLQGTFSCDLTTADLYSLGILDVPFTFAGCAHMDVDTDFKDYYKLAGSIGDMTLEYNNTLFRPDNLEMNLLTRSDTTYAFADCGDFHLRMNGRGGYKKMLGQVGNFTKELKQQLDDKHFDQALLRDKLPDANVYLDSGSDNFFVNLLEEKGYTFDHLLVDLNSSHISGLNGQVAVDHLMADSILLDEVRFDVITDSTGFNYNGMVRNGPDNPQYSFNAQFDGNILEKGADVNVKLYDRQEKLGLDLGVVAAIENNGVMFNLTKTNPVIGYLPFEANEDNYIFLGDDRRLSANLKLKSDQGAHIQVYTNDDNVDALQDLTLSLGKINLKQVFSILPYLPSVEGVADGDFHIVQSTENLSVSSTLNVADLVFEKNKMGNIGTEFVYMPNGDGSHHVDGILFSEGEEVGTLVGDYNPKGDGYLDATMHMNQFPLAIANGFIPDQLLGFKGTADGDLAIKGSLSSPDVNGELFLENTSIFSIPYGIEVNVADDPVRIVGSNLLFENFEVQDAAKTPLNISGYFDFSDLNNMRLDLRMQTRNFMVVNAKENPKSEAFGKAYVNFFGFMRGPLDALTMRGKVDVLGSTDMTYVMRDSPLTADTRLDELVQFVNFNDSIEKKISRPPLSGFNLDLTMELDEGARIKCDLNPDHSNYIDLVGGGNLRMQYNTVDNLRLTGRYTLKDAEMKYSLPIIPLKTFDIQEGSYIEFRGEPMNPLLHITATEDMKATVEDENGGTRSVNFNCGVVISQTLNDMGLEFIINAPDDVTIGSELASMTTEERGKVAVTMLTTGMYLADGNTSGFTMNGALSSFLQNEINNITGNALRTLDLSVGVDNATDASGSMHTDYSFKFAKRFWNNRLRIILGGKVSTGDETQNQSFFTNVTAEYRLSATSNKYLKLFYDRNSYDWLEGEIGEYGGGFLWRRKLQHFKDIFKFKTTSDPPIPSPGRSPMMKDSISADSVKSKKNE